MNHKLFYGTVLFILLLGLFSGIVNAKNYIIYNITNDAYVLQSTPTTNYGTGTTLQSRSMSTSSQNTRSYIGINLTSINFNELIYNYKIDTVSGSTSAITIKFFYCTNLIDENTITWNTQPASCNSTPFYNKSLNTFSATTYNITLSSQFINDVDKKSTLKITAEPESYDGAYRGLLWYSSEFPTISYRNKIYYVGANATITAKSSYNGSSILSFSVRIQNGSTIRTQYTSTGTITTKINSTYATKYKYNITFYNNSNHFNKTYLNYNFSASGGLVAYVVETQVNMFAREKITNSLLSGYFQAGTKNETSILYLKNGTFSIQFSKTGYFRKTQSFSFLSKTNVSRTIYNISDTLLNVTAWKKISHGIINNFTITIRRGTFIENDSTTTGRVSIYLKKNLKYNISIHSSAAATQTIELNLSSSYYLLNFSLYTMNSINFSFFDSKTGIRLNHVNLTMFSDADSRNRTSGSNTWIYTDLLSPLTYTLTYSRTNYSTSGYILTVVNETTTNISLYLSKTSLTTPTDIFVYDQDNKLKENVYIKMLKYDLLSNSYILQEVQKSNFEGQARFNVYQGTDFYKFILEYPLGLVVKETSPSLIFSDTINIGINLKTAVLENFFNSLNIYADVTFNNVTNNFKFDYNDLDTKISRGCLLIYRTISGSSSLINTSCVYSPTSSILLHVDNTPGYSYEAQGWVYFDSIPYFLESKTWEFDSGTYAGNDGLFLVALLCLAMCLLAYTSISLSIVMFGVPIIFGSILHLINLPLYMAFGVEIMLIVIAVWVSQWRK